MTTIKTTLLTEAKEKFGRFRESVVDAMAVLYDVWISKEWENVAANWGEYLESELQISQGFGSKLLTTYKHYCIEANLSQEKIIGIDYERLYLAKSLPGTPEEQIEKARVLTRTELRQERNDAEPVPHTPEWVEFCKVCNVSRANHG